MEVEEILKLCKGKGVSFSLNYAESDDTWWGSISSSAKEECSVTRNYKYLDDVLLRLKETLKG